ncbi:hypothetical protein [uncultured Varibaculum sp.]|uniref:hypothetical protein n=1 Tax=uncultured Varibaculum sp. TaxID=413896 RepID=UPI002889BA88|nr:hypothetical protein [uncultured Varibaculum sp.]
MDDMDEVQNQVYRLLDAMVLIPRAYLCLAGTKIEVKVNLEKSSLGYEPVVTTHIQGAVTDDIDTSGLESEVVFKAALLASAIKEAGLGVLQGILFGLSPVRDIGYVSFSLNEADDEANLKLESLARSWLFNNTRTFDWDLFPNASR